MQGGQGLRLRDPGTIVVPAGDVVSVPVMVIGAPATRGRQSIRFDVRAEDGSAHDVVDSSFFGPT